MSLEDARAVMEWSYADAKRECEPRVVRWEWATFQRTSLEPGYFEIRRYRRGDVLAEEPEPPESGVCGHGFDADGMLVVERKQVEFEGQYYETFYARRPGGIARKHFTYSPEKDAINAAFFELGAGDRVTRLDTLYANGRNMEQLYTYDAEGRLVREQRTGPAEPSRPATTTTYELEWDADGIARVHYTTPDGHRGLQFERAEPADSLARRRDELVTKLAAAAVAAIAAAAPDSPVYAIGLWWCSAEYQHRFPPNVNFATVADRDRFIGEHFTAARTYLWSPVEWPHEPFFDLDPPLLHLCNRVNADIWQHDRHAAADLVVTALAAELARTPLPFPTTADLVVFAVNVDSALHPYEQLERQLPADRRAAFTKLGWL